jgi:carboxypeptidase family protein/TonB-dependent receptor-like protein
MMRRIVHVALVALCLTALAVPSSAQVFTGRIDVSAKDGTGAILPGVTVELTGTQTATAVTDTRGEVHFLNLAPGRYAVTAKLSGFNDYKNDNVPVGAGSIVSLPVTLTVGGVTEKVDVTAPTPVIEAKKQTVSTNVSLDELQNIPSSRDPWVVLQTVPGIIVDRVNVGGAESGQQSNYQSKGASLTDNTWNIDGIAITDMAALGSSPTYYDFDMFQEMQVTTGGADPANPTPGVQLNFVLRSGTNRWRASGRYYYENNDLQSENVSSALAGTLQSYNRMEFYKDYGVEGGGPLLKDRLWAWGAYGKTNPALEVYTYRPNAGNVFRTEPGCKGAASSHPNDARTYAITARDCTILENYSAKVTGRFSENLRPSFTYFRGNKEKFGRGASATRPAPTTLNQTGPTDFYKGEVNYTLSNSIFLTGRYAYTSGGFSLEPVGGRNAQTVYDDAGIYQNTISFYVTDRPQHNAQFEGNYFKGKHEFKFGFGWRKASVASESGFPGGVLTIYGTAFGLSSGYPNMVAQFTRDWATATNTVYMGGFVGDQISLNRMTINAGLRWDRGVANLDAASVPADPLTNDPVLIAFFGQDPFPALTATAKNSVVSNSVVTPRIGVTYAVTESRKTIARGSYAIFSSQLSAVRGGFLSQIPATSTGSGYVYWQARDLNSNGIYDPGELVPGAFLGTVGFDPANPLSGNPDRVGDYKVPLTHEVVLGVEQELRPNLGISANFTWRKLTNFNWEQYRGVTGSDYVRNGSLTGTQVPIGPYDIPLYVIPESEVPSDFGRVFEHRNGYSQKFRGLEVAGTKRMANNWMLRVGWSTNEHREYFDNVDAMADPTPTVPIAALASPNKDGGLIVTQSSGSGKSNIFLVLPKYQYIMNAAYQAKWNITVGMNYLFRQGFSAPYYRGAVQAAADDLHPGGKNVLLVTDVGGYRLPNVHSLDGRLSWAWKYKARYGLNLDLDIFNMFNNSTILQRQLDLNLTGFNQAREIMNPRIFRLGARVQF